MCRRDLKETCQEYAELRRPFDQAMTLLGEAVHCLESTCQSIAEDRGDDQSLRAGVERARTMLTGARSLLAAIGPDENALPSYVERQISLVDDLLTKLG